MKIKISGGLTALLRKPTLLYVYTFDYQYLREFCSRLKFYKKLDSYKGKGVCFRDEIKLLKEGKKAQQ